MGMFDKLDAIEKRFNELDASMVNPEFFQNPDRARGLLKEHAGLKRTVERYREWRKANAARDEAKALAADGGGDEELKALALEELPSLEGKLQDSFNRLRDILVSEDADSTKDAIVEMQAGVGGDEAG